MSKAEIEARKIIDEFTDNGLSNMVNYSIGNCARLNTALLMLDEEILWYIAASNGKIAQHAKEAIKSQVWESAWKAAKGGDV